MSPAIEELRQQLRLAGFSPLPVEGKRPAPQGWPKLGDAPQDEITHWSKLYPTACNTGILTRHVPTLDIDVTDPFAAIAVERLVSDRFEEQGDILILFGRPPKRAILFKTDQPFAKILVKL